MLKFNQADILGYSWRSAYFLASAPGIVIAVLLLLTVKDPKKVRTKQEVCEETLNFYKRLYTSVNIDEEKLEKLIDNHIDKQDRNGL